MAESRQTKAKKKQNYQGKPLSKRCRTCTYLESKKTVSNSNWGRREKEKLRCSIGGFAVKPNGVCDYFATEIEEV